MKKLLAIFLCLLFLPVHAAESPKNGYVAKVSAVQLYAAEADSAPVFITIDDLETAEMYLEMGLITYFEENVPVYLCGQNLSYIQTAVNLPAAWENGLSGSGVLVGVLDSGVYPHTDFGANLLPGYNALTGTTDTMDNLGHGTRVAGLIAAASNGVGAVGAAPSASIVPIKCFDADAETTTAHIADAIVQAVKMGCKIINMSLGFDSYITSVAEAVDYAIGQGVILVAAAGNYSKETIEKKNVPLYPAAYPGVIGVGAVTESLELAPYSRYHAAVDIVTPGSCIGSTNIDGGYIPADADYNVANGTSFAAPIISGILALGVELAPTLSPTILEGALWETVQDLGSVGRDDAFGYGLADAAAFIEEVSKTDHTHLLRTSTGVSVYRTTPGSARIIFAHYANENELSSIFHTALLTLDAGYTGFDATIPENTRVFLFDGMRPLGKPLQY